MFRKELYLWYRSTLFSLSFLLVYCLCVCLCVCVALLILWHFCLSSFTIIKGRSGSLRYNFYTTTETTTTRCRRLFIPPHNYFFGVIVVVGVHSTGLPGYIFLPPRFFTHFNFSHTSRVGRRRRVQQKTELVLFMPYFFLFPYLQTFLRYVNKTVMCFLFLQQKNMMFVEKMSERDYEKCSSI